VPALAKQGFTNRGLGHDGPRTNPVIAAGRIGRKKVEETAGSAKNEDTIKASEKMSCRQSWYSSRMMTLFRLSLQKQARQVKPERPLASTGENALPHR
jgi:hypothetical protein